MDDVIKVGDETVVIAGQQPLPVEVVELEIAQSRQRQEPRESGTTVPAAEALDQIKNAAARAHEAVVRMASSEAATRAWVKIATRQPGVSLQSIAGLDATARSAAIEWATKIAPRMPAVMLRDWLALSHAERAWVRDELCVQAGPDAPIAGGLVQWPADKPPRYNGSGTPCDMWTGPCCCGATHKDGA